MAGSLEPMYHNYANGQALAARGQHRAPPHPGGYYASDMACGRRAALRMNSDVVTHPLVTGRTPAPSLRAAARPGTRRQEAAVRLGASRTLLAMFPRQGDMQRLRVSSSRGSRSSISREKTSRRSALMAAGWQAGAAPCGASSKCASSVQGRATPHSLGRRERDTADTIEACVEQRRSISEPSSMVERGSSRNLAPGMHRALHQDAEDDTECSITAAACSCTRASRRIPARRTRKKMSAGGRIRRTATPSLGEISSRARRGEQSPASPTTSGRGLFAARAAVPSAKARG